MSFVTFQYFEKTYMNDFSDEFGKLFYFWYDHNLSYCVISDYFQKNLSLQSPGLTRRKCLEYQIFVNQCQQI